MEVLERIREMAASQRHACITWRRHLHTYPELSYHEFKTADYIYDVLVNNGFEHVSRVGNTGVLATVNGMGTGKTLLLRADIDALAITEETKLDFRSVNSGVMHACGHDAHTAMLLSASKILLALKSEWPGVIKVLFQPAEEISPGGALEMIAAGVLQQPAVMEAIGQHVMPRLAAGKVGIKAGKFMASSDDFTITIYGRGGHAAAPENLIDPVVVAGHIIVATQQIISRRSNPRIPAVLSIGKIEAEGTFNVIPDQVVLKGTFRTLDTTWRELGLAQFEKLCIEIAASMGASCAIELKRGYPFLKNDEVLAASLRKAAIDYMGEQNVVDEDIWMAAEDFAYYSHQVPSVFYLLGVRNEQKGILSGLHTPTFTVDEDALPSGAGLMAWLAYTRMF